MRSRYTIMMKVVKVDDNGDVIDWIYTDMLEWATTDRSRIFAEIDHALLTLNENSPSDATMREQGGGDR